MDKDSSEMPREKTAKHCKQQRYLNMRPKYEMAAKKALGQHVKVDQRWRRSIDRGVGFLHDLFTFTSN